MMSQIEPAPPLMEASIHRSMVSRNSTLDSMSSSRSANCNATLSGSVSDSSVVPARKMVRWFRNSFSIPAQHPPRGPAP